MSFDAIVVAPTGARYLGRRFPCAIGTRGRTTAKLEGDGATPIGTLNIVGCLYRPDRIAQPSPWAQPINLRDRWSDDPADPAYNSLVSAPHGFSHETLRRPDALYDLILLTDWNWPVATAGKGSAIFLHRWRKPRYPTAGCVAFSPRHLLWIAQHARPGTKVIVL